MNLSPLLCGLDSLELLAINGPDGVSNAFIVADLQSSRFFAYANSSDSAFDIVRLTGTLLSSMISSNIEIRRSVLFSSSVLELVVASTYPVPVHIIPVMIELSLLTPLDNCFSMLAFVSDTLLMLVVIPLFAKVMRDSNLFTSSSFVGSALLVNTNIAVDFAAVSTILSSLALALRTWCETYNYNFLTFKSILMH